MSLALRKQRKHKDDSGKQNNETWRTLSAFPLTSSPESSWMSFQKWAISCYDTQGMAVCDRDISWKNRPLLSTSAGSAIFWCGWSIRGGGYIPSEMGSRLSATFLQTWEGGQQLGYLEGFYMGAFWARPRLSTVQSTLKWRHTGALCCKKNIQAGLGLASAAFVAPRAWQRPPRKPAPHRLYSVLPGWWARQPRPWMVSRPLPDVLPSCPSAK